MITLHDETVDTSQFALPASSAGKGPLTSDFGVSPRRAPPPTSASEKWRRHTDRWGRLMIAAQGGEKEAYDQLLRELNRWLQRYFGRRLPPSAADDARQDALLAVHSKRHTYSPSKPFGPWVAAIARYKCIDHLRDASRFATLSLDDEIPINDDGEAASRTQDAKANGQQWRRRKAVFAKNRPAALPERGRLLPPTKRRTATRCTR
jgi:DNA-directed RNA polymerase specialized sigma24 family protein